MATKRRNDPVIRSSWKSSSLTLRRARSRTSKQRRNRAKHFRQTPRTIKDQEALAGLRHTQFADAAVQTIRLKLFMLGAQVRTSVCRIHFALASGCPNKVEFELAYLYLQRAFSSA